MTSELPLRSYIEGDAWVCIFCSARNPLRVQHCANCGLSFVGGLLPQSLATHTTSGVLNRTLHPVLEVAIVGLLLLFWRLGSVATAAHVSHAVSRGRRLWQVERSLGLPSEASAQRLVLGHRSVLHGLDAYYAIAHLGGMAMLALWLKLRHAGRYPAWRNAVVLTTAGCFVLQLVAVAPPRLLPGIGVIDTAKSLGESVYDSDHFANQVSSMPSVHMAWALLVAAAVSSVGTTRKRWLTVTHPILTLATIILTGNHYWLDALAAAFVTILILLMQRWAPVARMRRLPPRACGEPQWSVQVVGERGREAHEPSQASIPREVGLHESDIAEVARLIRRPGTYA